MNSHLYMSRSISSTLCTLVKEVRTSIRFIICKCDFNAYQYTVGINLCMSRSVSYTLYTLVRVFIIVFFFIANGFQDAQYTTVPILCMPKSDISIRYMLVKGIHKINYMQMNF